MYVASSGAPEYKVQPSKPLGRDAIKIVVFTIIKFVEWSEPATWFCTANSDGDSWQRCGTRRSVPASEGKRWGAGRGRRHVRDRRNRRGTDPGRQTIARRHIDRGKEEPSRRKKKRYEYLRRAWAFVRAEDPPGFQGRRELPRVLSPRPGGESRPATSPSSLRLRTDLWALGLRSAHSSLAGRTVGVELVASPCQRLRGCRHLQPSTSLCRPTSDGHPSKCQRARAIHAGAWNFVFRTAKAVTHDWSPRKGTLVQAHGFFQFLRFVHGLGWLNAKGYCDRTRRVAALIGIIDWFGQIS